MNQQIMPTPIYDQQPLRTRGDEPGSDPVPEGISNLLRTRGDEPHKCNVAFVDRTPRS